ncbi:MAG TPA: FliI/YscN family ATPase [Phycisphaerales bacterium]|nr:FliI/YscN family ATPase [Phycisphaerales bacterium]
MIGLEGQIETVRRIQPMRIVGRVRSLRGLTVLVRDLPMPVGALVDVGNGERHALGEVIGFDGVHAVVMMLAGTGGIRPGDRVVGLHAQQTVGVGWSMLGRVLDGLGRPIDGGGPLHGLTPRPVDPEPISPMKRRRVSQPLTTGVRAMDLMTTLGRGQRLGIFAGPGVGKSTLLGQIARGTAADVSVVALIGERGREVKDFIEHTLGAEGLAKCVLVVATSDESALLRVRAAHVACTVAEFFREHGKSVLLLMDSITRFAHAQRQIGLSVGEPPATRGYTPSVFAALARMLERAGAMEASGGSITGLYSILVEGDDMTEPVADAARGILDGHVILSRKLAQRGQYPAIDVLDSISRVADEVCDQPHVHARRQIIRLLAAYKEAEDLIQIGAYAKGSNPATDVAIRYHDRILELLVQGSREKEPFEAAKSRMIKLAIEAGAEYQKLVKGKEGKA